MDQQCIKMTRVMSARKITSCLSFLALIFLLGSCNGESAQQQEQPSTDSTAVAEDPYTLDGERDFVSGYPARDEGGFVQVVVEIPTGTTDKWEVDKATGDLKHEFKNGKPRVVRYLGYPGNYGMVPRTLLPKSEGGDGDPLDVIVLGPPVPRGTVLSCKLLGVLKLLDGGEQDDKLVAVRPETPFFAVNSIAELDSAFGGVTEILAQWFSNYKGPGEMQAFGFAEKEVAEQVLETAIKAYQ